MKRILFALIVAFTICSLMLAQNKTTIVKDTIGKVKVTITETRSDLKKQTAKSASRAKATGPITVSSADIDPDSTYRVEYIDTPDDSTYVSILSDDYSNDPSQGLTSMLGGFSNSAISGGIAIVVVTLGMIFAFPLFIIFIAFYFRHRNRKARYRLIEQALAAGQPLPEGIFKESLNLDTAEKGIKNICLGLGLFIFLWAITESFGMGSIGLLVMFTGVGQWLVARNRKPTDKQI